MNPKDMTKEALFEACITAVRAWPDARTVDEGDRLWKLYEDTKAEILDRLARRLDEADALRKENEELRKDAERYRFIRDNAGTIAINSSLQYCDIYRSEGIDEGLDIAMKFESDYATSAKAKESEATHE